MDAGCSPGPRHGRPFDDRVPVFIRVAGRRRVGRDRRRGGGRPGRASELLPRRGRLAQVPARVARGRGGALATTDVRGPPGVSPAGRAFVKTTTSWGSATTCPTVLGGAFRVPPPSASHPRSASRSQGALKNNVPFGGGGLRGTLLGMALRPAGDPGDLVHRHPAWTTARKVPDEQTRLRFRQMGRP